MQQPAKAVSASSDPGAWLMFNASVVPPTCFQWCSCGLSPVGAETAAAVMRQSFGSTTPSITLQLQLGDQFCQCLYDLQRRNGQATSNCARTQRRYCPAPLSTVTGWSLRLANQAMLLERIPPRQQYRRRLPGRLPPPEGAELGGRGTWVPAPVRSPSADPAVCTSAPPDGALRCTTTER